jgi:uncharacterized protein (TIGR02996 family)
MAARNSSKGNKKNSAEPVEKQFLQAIDEQPEDRTVRLVYADWLEDRNDRRAEIVRVEEEMRSVPIYSDRYWTLKPRRAELRRTLDRVWLERMNYHQMTYEPVYREVPDGWKERWRLIREFAERWFAVPMSDIGGRKKEIEKIEQDQKVTLPPSLKEWVAFIADLQENDIRVDIEYGNETEFWAWEDGLLFLAHDGRRITYSTQKEHLKQPDPPVAWDYVGAWTGVVPHVTTLAFEFVRYLIKFQRDKTAGGFSTKVKLTRKLIGQLTSEFPVHSRFDECHSFESSNMIAWIAPNWFGPSSDLAFHVEVQRWLEQEEIPDFIWEMAQHNDALHTRRGIFNTPPRPRRRSR